jgi:Na+/H+ antiporter NhaD/arsenite permease-like protein
MNCGFPVRPPPRRPVGRLAGIVCLLLLATAFWAGPAGAAYTCESNGTAHPLAASKSGAREENCSPGRRVHREADPISFVFFIGILVAVVLVPVALNKREERPPE